MNVTRDELAMLAARRGRRAVADAASPRVPVTEGWSDGALTVFVPGKPRNPLNGSHEHWSKRAKWAKGWRERAAVRILAHLPRAKNGVWSGYWTYLPAEPKRITFTIYGAARFDDDNLRAVCKPVRDALKDMAVIDDDRPSAGHTFLYEQAKPTRKAGATHGIAIRVELAVPSGARPSAAPRGRG